jgi:hypothetical protein
MIRPSQVIGFILKNLQPIFMMLQDHSVGTVNSATLCSSIAPSKDDAFPATMEKFLRSVVLLICMAALLLTCLRILGHGFSPVDDALRHVAKVHSGKEWQDILVMRPEMTMDSHPGWHFILKQVSGLTRPDPTPLLNFSVLFLFLLFVLTPLFLFNRPEAWILALLAFSVFSFGTICRLFYGRPFIFGMFLIVVFCFLWERIRDKRAPIVELMVFAAVSALSTLIAGTWYLLALPICALGLARQWRVAALMAAAAAAGIFLGAALTGSPLIFLHQMIYHAMLSLGHHCFQRQLVSEFQSFDGSPGAIIVVAAVLMWRSARGQGNRECVDNPVFILGVIGWVLGFVTTRFWSDWGWPAFAFWTAMQVQAELKKYLGEFDLRRLVVAALACLTLFLALSNDHGSRWTGMLGAEWPQMTNAEHRKWLPEEAGILYSDGMDVFYSVFYNNPHGDWKYVLGFEPAWMPEDDLKIYRHIQLTRGRPESYAPWVKKMTEKDRLVLVRQEKPKIEGLDWHEVTPTVWSGMRIAGTQQPASHERLDDEDQGTPCTEKSAK